jgi:hypothetical protein
MKQAFTPEDWRKKEPKPNPNAEDGKKFQQQVNANLKLWVVNLSVRKQKTARSFMVTLNQEMPIEEIQVRVEKAFGDLK